MANPFGKMPGIGNIGELMKQAQKAMQETQKVEAELAAARVDGQSGGGLVKVIVSGKCDVIEIKIAKEAVDPEDVETLEDLVTLAVRDAVEKANKMREEKLNSIIGSSGLPGGLL